MIESAMVNCKEFEIHYGRPLDVIPELVAEL